MGKIDEVSRVVGRLEGSILEVKDDTKEIKQQIQSLCDKIDTTHTRSITNSNRLDEIQRWIENNKYKLGAVGAGGGSIAVAIIAFIKWLMES